MASEGEGTGERTSSRHFMTSSCTDLSTTVEPGHAEHGRACSNACYLYSAGEEDIGVAPNVEWSVTTSVQCHIGDGRSYNIKWR